MSASSGENSTPTTAPMDELLKLLKRDAHAPVEDLAKELNLTAREVSERISRLEKDGVI